MFKSFYARSYGNGLGRAMCKGIIDAHQGRIWVEAADEHEGDVLSEEQTARTLSSGSCFIFTLPIHPYTGGEVLIHTRNQEVLEDAHILRIPNLEELP